jgi:hypothetical protein
MNQVNRVETRAKLRIDTALLDVAKSLNQGNRDQVKRVEQQ